VVSPLLTPPKAHPFSPLLGRPFVAADYSAAPCVWRPATYEQNTCHAANYDAYANDFDGVDYDEPKLHLEAPMAPGFDPDTFSDFVAPGLPLRPPLGLGLVWASIMPHRRLLPDGDMNYQVDPGLFTLAENAKAAYGEGGAGAFVFWGATGLFSFLTGRWLKACVPGSEVHDPFTPPVGNKNTDPDDPFTVALQARREPGEYAAGRVALVLFAPVSHYDPDNNFDDNLDAWEYDLSLFSEHHPSFAAFRGVVVSNVVTGYATPALEAQFAPLQASSLADNAARVAELVAAGYDFVHVNGADQTAVFEALDDFFGLS
jgi:hypothetical protein